MKSLQKAVAGALLLLGLTGCVGGTSIVRMEKVPEGTVYNGRRVIGLIKAENRGMFLLNWIPLWTGKPHAPNFRQYKTFRNFLKQGYMDMMLEDEAKLHDAQKVAVMNMAEHSSGWFSLWLVWNRQLRAEGLALGEVVSGEKSDAR